MAPTVSSIREGDPNLTTTRGRADEEPKNFIEKYMGISKHSTTYKLMFGSIFGWLTSCVMLTYGKTAAIILGTSIFVLQFLQLNGYITRSSHPNVQRAIEQADPAEHANGFFKKIKNFAVANSIQAIAFTGGFVIGVYLS